MRYSKSDILEIKKPKGVIQKEKCGTLYVVSTPIGNLDDITLRALRVLKDVDMIAAENVGHTKGLCDHHDIKSKLVSYNQHNRKAKAPTIIRKLKSGHNVAIVTDAGTPGISDPGVYLITQAAKEDIHVSPIPGPSAVIAALSVSGLPAEQFVFLGFLPAKAVKRKKYLARLMSEPRTIVFFEAPHRIRAMLKDLKATLGDRQMVMLRELTKVFEDVKRGTVSEILEYLTPERARGEFTLVVAGGGQGKTHVLSEEVLNRIRYLIHEETRSIRDVARMLSDEEGISYRQIYRECLARKKDLERIGADGAG